MLPKGGASTLLHKYITTTMVSLFIILILEAVIAEVSKHELSSDWSWLEDLDKVLYLIMPNISDRVEPTLDP